MIIENKKKEQDLIDELTSFSRADEAFLITSSYLLDIANRAYDLFMSSQTSQKNELSKLVKFIQEILDDFKQIFHKVSL